MGDNSGRMDSSAARPELLNLHRSDGETVQLRAAGFRWIFDSVVSNMFG